MKEKIDKPFESEELDGIIDKFDNQRAAYRIFVNRGELLRPTFMEFQGIFNDLKADIRPFKNMVLARWTQRDDKAATAIKYRIATSIHKGELDGYEKCSINMAEKLAAGSANYKIFIDQRAFYKESYMNLREIRDDLNTYINEIKDHIKEIDKRDRGHG
jgi:hypothetical protein